MATIILRDAGSLSSPGSTAKGAPLTNLEVDNNFSNINVTLGVLSNLSTTANANLVVAINEIKNGNLRQFAATTSAQLAAVVSDETGTGNLVFSTSPTLVTPVLGIPTSANLINATSLPISTGVSGLGTGVATFLGFPTSANLITVVSDETGSGNLVFSTSPVLVTPNIGTPSYIVLTNATGTANNLTANIANFINVTDDTTTNATRYPILSNGTSGNITESVSSTKLFFNPATGLLTTNNITVQNATLNSFGSIRTLFESGNVVATAANANIQMDLTVNAVQYFTSNATINSTINFRANSTATLNSIMNTANTVSSAVLITNGNVAYYPTVYQVDGSAVIPKWQSTPIGGNTSATDLYTFTIVKTAAATFTVFASQTRFA